MVETPPEALGDVDFLSATEAIPETVGTAPGAADAQIAPSQAAPSVLSEEMVQTVIGLPFAAVAAHIGKGGEFWGLSEEEKQTLAKVWTPVLAPLWAKWIGDASGEWIFALTITMVTLGPRLARENSRRASMKESMGTASVGDSALSPDQPVPASPGRQTDLSAIAVEFSSSYPLA